MQEKLKSACIYRGGITRQYSELETDYVSAGLRYPGAGIDSIFQIGSAGGGATNVRFTFNAPDYELYLRLMIKNNRKAALQAMSKIFQEEMNILEATEDNIVTNARWEIVNALTEPGKHFPNYNDPAIRKLFDIINKLNEKSSKK